MVISYVLYRFVIRFELPKKAQIHSYVHAYIHMPTNVPTDLMHLFELMLVLIPLKMKLKNLIFDYTKIEF